MQNSQKEESASISGTIDAVYIAHKTENKNTSLVSDDTSFCMRLYDWRNSCNCRACSVDVCDPAALYEYFELSGAKNYISKQKIRLPRAHPWVAHRDGTKRYSGEICNRMPHGWGKCEFLKPFGIFKMGDIIECWWYKGSPINMVYWTSGNRYMWARSIDHNYCVSGETVEQCDGRCVYSGRYDRGMRNGMGTLYKGDLEILSYWKDNHLVYVRHIKHANKFLYIGTPTIGMLRRDNGWFIRRGNGIDVICELIDDEKNMKK